MRFLPIALLALPALAAARPHNSRHHRRHHHQKRSCSVIPPTPTGQTTMTEVPTSTDVPTSTEAPPITTTPVPPEPTNPPSGNTTMTLKRGYPADGIRGVNFGSQMLIEPWMMEQRWRDMGGEICGSCMECVGTEFDLVKKLGQEKADEVFANHWDTFITQEDVKLVKQYNLNSVRIPLGFWIIEETVNRDNEYYPRGGLDKLRRMCGWLADEGITVLLDLHAAPGGSTGTNAFAGRCVDPPQFWGNDDNVSRHIAAAKKLTEIVHAEPEHFRTVWGIEALNEPPQDGNQTPGYMDFMTNFAKAVREAEASAKVAEKDRLQTVFMDLSWQWQNNAGNPAYAANGGSAYDAHMYTNWGGAGGPKGDTGDDIDQHVRFACMGDGGKIEDDAKNFNTPMFRGEWWLLGKTTQILDNFDKDNIRRWADAQKMGYMSEGGNNGGGWYFWSWLIENGDDGGWTHMRSYRDAVQQGYMHEDAAKFFDPDVCKKALGQ